MKQEDNKSYEVPKELRIKFTPDILDSYTKNFKGFDKNDPKIGKLPVTLMKQLMESLGYRSLTENEMNEKLAKVTRANPDSITFIEFLNFMILFKEGPKHATEIVETGESKILVTAGEVGYHSVNMDELDSYISYINEVLENEKDLAEDIPIKSPEALFDNIVDGLVLSRLLFKAKPEAVFEKTLNRGTNLNKFKIIENLNFVIATAKSLGCQVINITPFSFIEKRMHIVLGLCWQILKLFLVKEVNLKTVPEIIVLQKEGEKLEDVLRLSPDQILLRWLNYHLKKANSSRVATNFESDLKDSEIYLTVLNSISPSVCSKEEIGNPDLEKRAFSVIDNAAKLGVEKAHRIFKPKVIVGCNQRLNIMLCTLIFNCKHGLEIAQEKKAEVEKAVFIDEKSEDSAEELTYKNWVNSLGLEGVTISNLIEDCHDGLVMIKLIEKVAGITPDKKKYDPKHNNNRLKMMINTNYVLELCKQINIKLVAIGGVDILDKNKKMLFALLWQIMRQDYMKHLGNNTEDDLVNWANSKVKDIQIKSLKDPILKKGKFFLRLCDEIYNGIVDKEIAKEGENDEERRINALYTISILLKKGSVIYTNWKDIVGGNTKANFMIIASLFILEKSKSSQVPEKKEVPAMIPQKSEEKIEKKEEIKIGLPTEIAQSEVVEDKKAEMPSS